jgi:hypothetical protein
LCGEPLFVVVTFLDKQFQMLLGILFLLISVSDEISDVK